VNTCKPSKVSDKTGYSHHILNAGYSYRGLENSLEILNFHEKGSYPNTSEKFPIYRKNKQTID
jgi:hypothetical protein